MKTCTRYFWSGLLLGLCVLVSGTRLSGSTADDAFEKLARAAIEELLETNPETATALGDHRFDDRLTDYSQEALSKAEKLHRELLSGLNKIDAGALTGANRVDIQ